MKSSRLLLSLLGGCLLSTGPLLRSQTQYATPYHFSTFAGDSSPGSNDGSGSAARFWNPTALAALPDGTVYVLDNGNKTVRRLSPGGVVTTVLGEVGLGIGYHVVASIQEFMSPLSLAIDQTGDFYVSDSYKIFRISPNNTTRAFFAGASTSMVDIDGEGSAARFSALRNITFDRAGNLYAISAHAVRKITPAGFVGVVSTLAGKSDELGYVDGSAASARFGVLTGLACDAAGNVYAIDRAVHVIRKITPTGTVSTFAGQPTPIDQYLGTHADGPASQARFYLPEEMTIDVTGNLYVGDIFTIRKVAPDGTVTTLAGSPEQSGSVDGTGATARFARITGLVVAANGDLIVSDGYNNTIRRVTPAGVVTTIAGSPPSATTGTRDGPAAEARFSDQIAGVAIASSGNVYVADAGNHTIRRITPAGVVSTLAGQPGVAGSTDGTGSAATFNEPQGVAVDGQENIYVTEPENYLVRKITPAGVVTTLAGLAGTPGSTDAVGSAARFWNPFGIAVDGGGNVYVTDFIPFLSSSGYIDVTRRISPSGTVTTVANIPQSQPYSDFIGDSLAVDSSGNVHRFYRYSLVRITQAGELTTLAGKAADPGLSDGIGAAASFIFPTGLTMDASGSLYVTDAQAIRKVTATGTVSTLAGVHNAHGYVNGTGRAARFSFNFRHNWLAADATGKLLVPTGSIIRRGQPAGPPGITTQPQGLTVASGGNVQFSVTAAAVPEPTYQWNFNGNAIAGATGSSLNINGAQATNAGNYAVVVTNSLGSVTSNAATLTVTSGPANPPPGGGSGGGGAPSLWFFAAVLAACAARFARRPGLTP